MTATLRYIIAAVLLASLAGGLVVDRVVRARQPATERAEWLLRAGRSAEAEALYFREIELGPITVPLVVALLDAHAAGGHPALPRKDGALDTFAPRGVESIREHAIDALLQSSELPPDVTLLGRFWRDVHAGAVSLGERRDVERAADAEPPMPWANHLLARDSARDIAVLC